MPNRYASLVSGWMKICDIRLFITTNVFTTFDFLLGGNPKWEGEGPAVPVKNMMFSFSYL